MKTKHQQQLPLINLIPQIRCLMRVSLALSLVALGGCMTNKNLQPPQATATTGAGGFDEADANDDGKLERREANDFLVNEIFTSRDANHDGRLTQREWSAWDPARVADFKKRDADGDAIVTRDEAIEYGRAHGVANKILREADKNHDGALDRGEVQSYYASREGPPR